MTVQNHEEEQVLTMRDLVVNYLQLAKRGVRYWMRGAAVFTLIFLAGMVWVVTRPRVYKSEARFQVQEAETPNQEQRNDEETTRWVEGRLNQVFNSRRYIISIIQQYHLYDHLIGRTSEQKIADLFSGALDRRVERDTVALGFTYKDPAKAQQVTRALINLFVNERKMAAVERSTETLRNLEAQVREIEGVRLERQERFDRFVLANQEMVELIRRRRAAGGASIPTQATPSQAVDEHSSRRTRQLRAKLAQLSQQIEMVRNPGSTPAATASEPEEIGQMRERVREKRSQVDGMRARGLTESHPTRLAAERELSEMEAQLQGMVARHRGARQIEQNMSDAERARRVEDIQREINSTRAELAESERADRSGTQPSQPAAATPRPTALTNIVEVETQYDRLMADLTTAEQSYSALLQRKFNQQAELRRIQLSGGESVRIIDPPSLPIEPEPPGRVKLASIVMLVALLLGLGTALISGFMDTRVYDMGDLRRWGELPELPFVPDLYLDAPRRGRASSVPPQARASAPPG